MSAKFIGQKRKGTAGHKTKSLTNVLFPHHSISYHRNIMVPRDMSALYTGDTANDAVLGQILSIARSCGAGRFSSSLSETTATRMAHAKTILAQQLQRCDDHGTAELGKLTSEATQLIEAIAQVQKSSSSSTSLMNDKEESSLGQMISSSPLFQYPRTAKPQATGRQQNHQLRDQSQQLLHKFMALQRGQKRWMEQNLDVAVAADQAVNGSNKDSKTTNHKALFRTVVQDHVQGRTDLTKTTHPQTAHFIVLLSDIGTLLQQLDDDKEHNNNNNNKKDALWTPPSDFERKTTKYWVEDSQLPQVMAVTASEVPLLVFGTQGLLSQSASTSKGTGAGGNDDQGMLWGPKCASQITSVYLDTADMKFYHERLRRSEGAQLLRARWYGRHQPVDDEPLFLELKTHHEVWIGQNSIKQRVTILAKFMPAFLSFTKWSRADAERIITATATPKLSAKELDSAIALLWEMHQLVVLHQMRPCVRSVYARVAFQASHSNALRFTMDRNVRLYDEMRPGGATTAGHHKNWCIPDSALASAKHVVLPYAIFEVKLAGSEMPVSIGNLIESGQVVEAFKFSKYLTGAAAFNLVDMLPYWADHPNFQAIFSSSTSSSLPDNLGRSKPRTAVMERKDSSTDDSGTATPLVTPRQRRPWVGQWFVNPRFNKNQVIKPKTPVRVEPKSYFANERTFIQWISIAVLLATIDSLIPDDGLDVVTSLKQTIMVVAGCLILYSVSVYYYRLYLLRNGKPYGYTDVVGPAFLVVAVLFGGCILLIKMNSSEAAVDATLVSALLKEGPGCHRHAHFLSSLAYEPSDILVNGDRLLVPAKSQVTAISKSSAAAARTLVKIPGTDLESITAVGDRIFVVSEGKEESSLIELTWVSSGDDRLKTVGTWPLMIGKVEGMTYVPDTDGDRLYFGDNDGFVHTTLVPAVIAPAVFSAGEASPPLELEQLNQKLFGRGLVDPKIASLQYMDGILYVLHDNAGVIRGWDLLLGVLRSEWKLPLPDNGTNDQIEGFFLESQAPVGNSSLRGGGAGGNQQQPFLLHLAVDTPAQLWTLSVNVNPANGDITYPACAQ
jgi:SPX domain protein involved in polyphosphate accumulation/uncharacterized membrane protein YidH (DUF202 family)